MHNRIQGIRAGIHSRLTVFLVAADHLSFTRAGQELHITTGAVSQQIKQLEDWLGHRLFRRLSRRLELTDAGKRLLNAIDPAYSAVDLAVSRLRGGTLSGVVRLRTLPSFLATWLTPRLPKLMAQFPQIELQIEAEDSKHSLRDGEFDLAIDLNDGLSPGFKSSVLLEEEIFPVCAPSLLDSHPPLLTPGDLRHYPILHDMTAWRGSSPYGEWERYLKAVGAPDVDVRRGYMFNRNHITVQCAIAGMGVAMARRTLITDELDSGRLVQPFPDTVQTGKRYYLVYPSDALADPLVAAVHDWVVGQTPAGEQAMVYRPDALAEIPPATPMSVVG